MITYVKSGNDLLCLNKDIANLEDSILSSVFDYNIVWRIKVPIQKSDIIMQNMFYEEMLAEMKWFLDYKNQEEQDNI